MGQEMALMGGGEEFESWYRKGKGNFYIEIWLLKLERIYAYFDICIDMCIDIFLVPLLTLTMPGVEYFWHT